MNNKSLKPLAVAFFMSGIWDTIAGLLYIFAIGNGRMISEPAADPFYTVFLGSFFLCFAWLQFMASQNIGRYSFLVGCLIFGRTFYVIQLYGFMAFAPEFPATFWFTGIIDGAFLVAYFLFARRGGLPVRDLFLPKI